MAIPYIVCRKVDATKKEKPQLWYAVGKKMQKKSGRTERDVAHRVAQRTGFHPGVVEAVLAAIEDGMYHPSMKEKMAALEKEKAELTTFLADRPEPPALRLHPRLSDLYREKIAALAEALSWRWPATGESVAMMIKPALVCLRCNWVYCRVPAARSGYRG